MNSTNYYQLSNPQKRIWLTEQVNSHKDMSNIGYLIEFKGKYNLDQLAQSIKYVVKQNKALQLRFKFSEEEKGDLLQYLPGEGDPDIVILQVDTEEELYKKIDEIHRHRFDMKANNFCSFVAFSIKNERFGFFEKAHHLVADGISATIVAREVIETYQKLTNNEFKETIKEYSYFDFLEDEKKYVQSEKYKKDKEFWTEKLKDYEGEEFNFSYNKTPKNSLKVKRISLKVPQNIIEMLENYQEKNRISNFGLFMAALAIYFRRFMNHQDMIIGMPVHNRSKKIFREMVGMFVSTIPLRIQFDDKWNFDQLVAYIKKELWDSLKHQGYPFNHLVKDLKDLGIETSGLLNVQLIELPGAGHDEIKNRAFFNTAYNISNLSIYLNQQNNKNLQELDVAIDFHEDIFEERDIVFFFKRMMTILEQTIKEPVKKISELPLMDEKEFQESIYHLNNTNADFPSDQTLSSLFEAQVSKNPSDIALEYEGQEVPYQELDELAQKLAAKLQNMGLQTGTLVGILSERSIEVIICILAILKAGGAYLPIDPEYPLDRKNYIIENSGIQFLLLEKALAQQEDELIRQHPDINTMTIHYQTLLQEESPKNWKPFAQNSEQLAYVIYTSGTTGNPKGTLLRHRNVINYAWWGAKNYVKGEVCTFPLFTSLSFDLTVTSIFIPLITGNKIIIYRDNKEGLLIEKVIKDNKVDIIKLTPSHLKVLNQMNFKPSRLKSLILGGEELKTNIARETHELFNGKINIYNEYGPTETAVGCMIHRYDIKNDQGVAVPIGVPVDNAQIYILDKERKPLPHGVIGEIYIGGQGVAQGYLKNQELTNEKFLDNPFIPGEKMYKSGDLARWNLDNILEFYGRCDEQVKIRGYRIELGEIEKQLMKKEEISDAVVSLRKSEQPELCAYLVVDEEYDLNISQLRDFLAQELPTYMLPSEFIQIHQIPLTRNGKVDFRKLENMGKKLAASQEYVAPRDEKEKMLADIWAAVLDTERVGITENFYELGGDSIKAVQIAARMNDAGKSINVKDILTLQTIANICANVDFESHIRKYEQDVLSGEIGITPIQNWFLSQEFPNPHHFHQSVLLEFKTPIDMTILEKMIQTLIKHHDGLRLNYNLSKNKFYFNNDLIDAPIKIETVDLSNLSLEEQQSQIEIKGYEFKSQFNINNGPMLKAVIFRSPSERDQLLLILHHLVTDGLTWRILLEEIYNLYNAFQQNMEIELPQKTASLLDWYDALVMFRDSGKLENQIQYWQEADATEFKLPYDTNPENIDWSIKNQQKIKLQLDEDTTHFLLKEAHEVYKTDVQILVTVALVRALRQWTGKQSLVIEMENHGRHIEDIDTSKTTGWFTALYPLLVNRPVQTIGDEIKAVKENIRKVPEKGIGYGILKYMSPLGKSLKSLRSEIRFNYLGQFHQEVENPLFSFINASTGSDIAMENPMTTSIEINAMIINGHFEADIFYNKNAFKENTLTTFADQYIEHLEEILDHIKNEDDVHFTPSDFDTVDLSEEDLAALFE